MAMQKKVIAFNGSPRKDGNTFQMLNMVAQELTNNGIETEIVQLGGNLLWGCLSCGACFKQQNGLCANKRDTMNEYIARISQADGVLIGSPTYFSNVSTEVKALIDRAGMVAKANHDLFRYKVGAAVVAVRRAGSVCAFDAINHFFLISQMTVPGSIYWNMGIGLAPGDVQKDDEGVRTMSVLGRNMTRLLLPSDS